MMNHDLKVTQTITVNASLASVWGALTNPAIIKDYLYGTETVTTWDVNSPIVFQGEYEGFKYRDHGMIKEYIPLQRISYSYWSGFTGLEDAPQNYSTVSYDVSAVNDTTTAFTWTQTGYANEERHQHSQAGMTAFLETVKAVMER
jgi:uncharacterized protein YndB with AHSA1/START domain